MLNVLYEDQEIIVVIKPAGVESQAAKKFAPDMISEIKKHMVINKLCTPGKEPYVAVIHRLDKPVSGVMVYAKTKKAAAALSEQVQNRKMDKYYEAVVCGKPVNNVDNYVDYLKKSVDGNYSQIVDKGENEAKRAELSFELLKTVETEDGTLSHVRIHLLTGRHHQIRVQFSGHELPLYGDGRYNPQFVGKRDPLALCAVSLAFNHPTTGKRMEFSMKPSGGAFRKFVG
ncbi:MAG: RluA family pseudouridine synthase [Lachnospiraceae bacterium]|nr:RluA family pseudouridine synthase [Lachnospiraceae bacterium]